MIDFNEVGMNVEHRNCKYCKCLKFYHVDSNGAYNQDKESNLLLAILGNDTIQTNYWMEMQEEGGIILFRFYNFKCRVIISLGDDHPGCSFCFTVDNLDIHHNPAVLQMIHDAGYQ